MIPFSPPRIDQEIIDEVVDTLKSGWITTGPKTKKFELELSGYCGNAATLCLNSATAGLELILRWFGVKDGDEVIVPAYTYSATANVVLHCGAKPVFVDVLDDFTMDPAKVTLAINSNTKVIMPVDIGGWPCDYDSLFRIVKAADFRSLFRPSSKEQTRLGRILVLSDAAHSLGAHYHNRKAGTLADISVFSFHAVKNLTTAEGGAVALNLPLPFDNPEVYKFLCILSLHGQNKDALSKMQAGNWKYDILMPGYKMNMTDLLASIGRVELRRYESEILPKRMKICKYYQEYFSRYPWAILPLQEDGAKGIRSSYHLFPLRIRGISESRRDRIMERVFRAGVSVNVHFIPLTAMTCYRELGYRAEDYPKTLELYRNEISLPVYFDLSEENMKMVADTVASAVLDEIKNPEI
ncbi:MAG: DegT/DnrJ/EryC1/StrS aminotransferase family protein [Bacteroidia bacterium]|nr:DegT/DnrJ/EryC1/StrS aminotransferase family protein [Bacteroidia bacterium]